MATQNNTIKTRIQLKSDTEANWNKAGPKQNSLGFVPLAGELIIYLPDSTHDYSRLKVGDGTTNVIALPFIDAGSISGQQLVNEIVQFSGNFPSNGDSTKLYVNTSTNAIYYYNGTNYIKLSNFTYTFTKTNTSYVSSWDAGRQPVFSLSGGTFSITSGAIPTLTYNNSEALSTVTKEGDS